MLGQQNTGLAYEVVKDRMSPDTWRAEAIDGRSEGECYVACFMGPRAEDMAREYAAWKNDGAANPRALADDQ
jgi:hypothetical protein